MTHPGKRHGTAEHRDHVLPDLSGGGIGVGSPIGSLNNETDTNRWCLSKIRGGVSTSGADQAQLTLSKIFSRPGEDRSPWGEAPGQ